MTPILKKLFTSSLLLILTAQIASAALTPILEPELEPATTIKKVIDPTTNQEVLIETKPVVADPTKISKPVETETKTATFEEGEPITAKIKILEIKKTTKEDNQNQTASALAEPIITGLDFLASQQNSDGSFGSNTKTKFIDTSAATEFLNNLNQKIAVVDQPLIDSILPDANEWIGFSFPENNDYLSQKISILNKSGDDVASSMDYLANQINDVDLGFGFKKKFASDVVTTAKVLKVIAETNYQDPGPDPDYTTKAALIFLLYSQNSDGGWPELKGESSSLYSTNLVLQSLYPYRNTTIEGLAGGDTILPTKINLGFNFLNNYHYVFEGSWQGDLLLTALSYENFLQYGRTPSQNQLVIDYLKNQQSADGSFVGGNIFKTAKALQALAKPDIVVADIQNPLSVPNPEAVIWATVRNSGYLTTEPINLSANPPAFHLFVDNQEAILDFSSLPSTLTLEPSSEVIFQIEFSKPIFGQHSIKFKTDYASPELIKTNNELTRALAFDSPQFTGPQPPDWIGAFTGSGAGDITLRWRQSSDPARSYYAIFAATASGGYAHNSPLYVFPPDQNYAGITFTFDSIYYNLPIYFTVVSYDSNGNRGNYSPETYAYVRQNPENYRGTLAGRVFNTATNQNIPNTEIDFYLINDWFSDGSGNYSINFYPGFYLVSFYKSGFQLPPQFLNITANQTTNLDIGMNPLADGTPPSPVANLRGTASDGQILIEWDPYLPPSDFKRFNVYRSNSSFGSQSGDKLIATISSPSATSFNDTTIVNGLNYFYAVVPEDLSGASPSVSSVGAFKGNSRPSINNFSATQNGPNITLFYDLSDLENDLTFVAFEYWNGSIWADVNSSSGEGSLTPGPGKIGMWNAKSEFPNFDGQTKVRIKTWNSGYFFDAIYFESDSFSLDTTNPIAPTVNTYPTKTALVNRAFAGTKEANSSLDVNGEELVPVNSQTTWSFQKNLITGSNFFVLKSFDAQTNESLPAEINITYDPGYFMCGDLDGNEVIDILDVSILVDIAFRNGPYPTIFERGDLNADGVYDILDVTLLVNHAFRNAPAPTGCAPY